jgi:hypothetical protein
MTLATQKAFPRNEQIFHRYDILIFMDKHEYSEKYKNTPPAQAPLVLVKTKEAYQLWHDHMLNLKRFDRLTLGAKIDDIFVSILELIFRACFAYDKFEKLSLVSESIGKNDLLKFFLQIGWEHKMLNHGQYGKFILQLDEIGRMLGGWKKSLVEKTPTNK